MEESASRTDHDEKENPVSASPDSGVCDLDTSSEDQTKLPPPETAISSPAKNQPQTEGRFRYSQSYDPFFFKYATDNRKLTLLKSLSQDSEYSLDTSLFDAEEFLQDMGFAGGSDPTIPDRFLPSLMQRLSKFPESEMESLHHRIVQSIGCFRRKEGKRRLFRNLSMGKGSSVDHFGKTHLSCPSNNYPLLRSNTGPAEFPFNEATTCAYEVNNNSLKSGRVSSSDSGHHSMDSLKNEEEFPESPIAILVSSASVELEDKSTQEEGVQVSMNDEELLVGDVSSDSVLTSETARQTSDGEFMNTVQEIQKLTDDISSCEGVDSLTKDCHLEPERNQSDSQNALDDVESTTRLSKVLSEGNLPEKVEEISIECKFQTSVLHSDKSAFPANSAILSPVKRPLRRISNAQSYNPLRHSKGFGSLEHQKNINEDDDDLVIEHSDVRGPMPTFNESNDNCIDKYNSNPFKTDELDDVSGLSGDKCGIFNESTSNFKPCFSEIHSNDIGSTAFSSNDKSFNSSPSPNAESLPSSLYPIELSESFSNRMATVDSKPETQARSLTKPNFTRVDSLTNFLSSMLDTSENDSFSKTPVTPPNSLVENQSKSDTEILEDNISSEKFSVQYNFNKAQSSEALSNTQSFLPFTQNINYSEVKSTLDKSPNRKRRVLRRMSSSRQFCDDDNCEDPDGLAVNEGFQFSPTNPFVSPKLPLRVTKSDRHDCDPGHRRVHPVSSLPPMNQYSPYKIQNEIGGCTNPFAYSMTDNLQSNSDPEATKVYYRKREKRNCKKRRYFSNTDIDLYSNSWVRAGSRDSSKFNITCGTDICNHQYKQNSVYNCSPETHRYYRSSCKETCYSRMNFDERYPEWDHCLSKESLVSCANCSSSKCPLFPSQHCQHFRNSISSGMPMKGSFRHCMWNSTPDMRYGYSNSGFKDYHGRPKMNSVHDFPMEQCGNLSAASSCCDVAHLPDDVFIPDKGPYCCAHSSHHPDNIQTNINRKLKVRMPQRQNSMSIDDADDHPFQNRKISAHRNIFQNSILNQCGDSSNTSSPPNGPSRKVSVAAPPPNIPDTFNEKVHNKDMAPVSTEEKLTNSLDSQFNHSTKNGPIANNKNEALLERKIRIFSKFFANLGSLSKSFQDRHSDNEHKEKRDARFYDVIGTDKPRKSSVRSDFKALPPRKCTTPPPEFDRLIHLLESPSSRLEKSDECGGTSHRTNRERGYPVYENRVLLQAIPRLEGTQRYFKPVQFTSSVSMYIHSDESKEESNVPRKDNLADMGLNRDTSSLKSDEHSRPSSQMSFKVVSKELEDLQQSIQKAKEMRISASKELHLLQELLSGDDNAEGKGEVAKEKKFPTVYPAVHLKDTTFKSTAIEESQALKDLREKSKKEVLEDTSFWQEEIRKVKEETKQAWQEKLDCMEAQLSSQEEELRRLQSENENLHKSLELQRHCSPTCHCRSESAQNGFGRIDSAFEDDEEYLSHKPSIPIQPTRQECDRLQERLSEEEQRADQLKLLLNQKLIDFNKLQITLSKQTKEMIELEKSYLQLQCRLRKGTSKPLVARICSRTSPFNSKNLCPKPSPPATPQPNGIS